jgi:hypothetical protein
LSYAPLKVLALRSRLANRKCSCRIVSTPEYLKYRTAPTECRTGQSEQRTWRNEMPPTRDDSASDLLGRAGRDLSFVANRGVVNRAVEEPVQRTKEFEFSEDTHGRAVHSLAGEELEQILFRQHESPG